MRIQGLTRDNDLDFDSTWTTLSTALQEIHTKNASKLSFEELYRNAYKIVLKKKAEMLYDRVSELEERWLRDTVRAKITTFITPVLTTGSLMQSVDTQANERRLAGERFLAALKDAYQDHQMCMSMITDVLMYMDRVYCQDQRRPSIFTTAMALFRIHVLQTPFGPDAATDVMAVLETIILDMIRMERHGEVIDRALIRACCYMLEGLYESVTEDENTKLYLTSFEPKFLESSRAFYRQEGEDFLANADASTFCSQARKRLREEEERCQQTLSTLTENKIKNVVDRDFIAANLPQVVEMEGSGARHMLDNDRIDDLQNLFDLAARVDPKRTALKTAVQKRVIELGTEINKNAAVTAPAGFKAPGKSDTDGAPADKSINAQTAAAITWVEDILKLKGKYDRIWEVAFKKDAVLEKALEVSFQDFINANARSPEYLSLFLDEYLRKGGKGKGEAEVDALLDNGIILLQYIANKDEFERYYKKHMSRRLLKKVTVSRDMERQMISKMKTKIGNTFTQKLEGLLKDMNISDDLNVQYKKYVANLGDPDPKRIDLEASICTSTVWPFDQWTSSTEDDGSPRRECIYPPELDRILKRFEKFYLDKHSGRALRWLPALGTVDVRIAFRNAKGVVKRHDVNVPTYGIIILLLFPDQTPDLALSFDEIKARTNIPTNELVRSLISLAVAPKTRLLKKEPMSKDIKPTDVFSFNDDFSSQYTKIKVGVIANSSNRIENNEERKETQKRADEERGVAIEAAIVRIMKQRKELQHGQLMSETLALLSSRFSPDVNMVKKKIEALIDREYLERGPNPDKPSYVYLA